MSEGRSERDALHHTGKIQARLHGAVNHLRADAEKADEPRLKAMSETSAEMPEGPIKAVRACERKEEPAWRG